MGRQPIRFVSKPLVVAALVALVVHLNLLLTGVLPLAYHWWTTLFPRPNSPPPSEVTLVAMTPRQWEENRQVQAKIKIEEQDRQQEMKQVQSEAEKEKEKEKELKGQVVDLAPTPDDRPPDDARFLSEHNTRVEKESISRDRRPDYGVAQSRPTVAESARKRQQADPDQTGQDRIAMVTRKRGDRSQANPEETWSMQIPDVVKRDALRLKMDLKEGQLARFEESQHLRGNSDKLDLRLGKPDAAREAQAGDNGEQEQTLAMTQQPSLEHLDMVTGAPANDHVDDVPKGEETLLNSREFKYATFFNRVKRNVSQHWAPRVGEEYMRRDPYGNIYGVKDRYTVLNVTLSSDGSLSDVSVARSSGIHFFDDVAVSAFRDASPFPNPPKGLVDDSGQIQFQFGFFFEIGERPRMRPLYFERR